MSIFPPNPVPPKVFFEDLVPALFATLEFDDAERGVDLKIGVILRAGESGEGGGEWSLHLSAGELRVEPGRVEDCEITIVQPVDDWTAALWGGRPALIADAVASFVAAGPDALRESGGAGRAGNPAALKGLSEIQGLIEAIIAGDSDAPDWRIGIQIGPGPIPDSPQATILLGAAQAEAIRKGVLHPIEALMTGQLRLEGDLGLILQLQAVAMTATMSKPPSP